MHQINTATKSSPREMTKRTQIGLRLSDAEMNAVSKLAKAENRSLSNMARLLMLDKLNALISADQQQSTSVATR
jgi:hypothetical protein